MKNTARAVGNFLIRKPVLLGAAVVMWFDVWGPSPLVKAAIAGTVAWLVSSVTTSNKRAEETVEQARYVGLVEGESRAVQAPAPTPPPLV